MWLGWPGVAPAGRVFWESAPSGEGDASRHTAHSHRGTRLLFTGPTQALLPTLHCRHASEQTAHSSRERRLRRQEGCVLASGPEEWGSPAAHAPRTRTLCPCPPAAHTHGFKAQACSTTMPDLPQACRAGRRRAKRKYSGSVDEVHEQMDQALHTVTTRSRSCSADGAQARGLGPWPGTLHPRLSRRPDRSPARRGPALNLRP